MVDSLFSECRLEGKFTLSSGRVSNFFYDFDLLSPKEVAEYVEQLITQIPEEIFEEVDFIAAPALGGIVPGFLIAFAKNKPFVTIDKGGNLRGPQFDTGRYLIVDDVITSFKAANSVQTALAGMDAVGIAAYVFRGTRADLDKQDIPAFYLSRKEQEE